MVAGGHLKKKITNKATKMEALPMFDMFFSGSFTVQVACVTWIDLDELISETRWIWWEFVNSMVKCPKFQFDMTGASLIHGANPWNREIQVEYDELM